MFSQPLSAGQPTPQTTSNNVKKAVRTILILVFVVIIVIVLSLSVILSGHIGITPSPTPTAIGGNSDLQLTLSLEKTTYILGEPVNLTVTITNISNQTVNFTHTGLDFDFQVYNDTNNLIYEWSNFRGIAQFITIEPFTAGESMSQNFIWLQTCNFNASVQEDQVSTGTYFIGRSNWPNIRNTDHTN